MTPSPTHPRFSNSVEVVQLRGDIAGAGAPIARVLGFSRIVKNYIENLGRKRA